MNKKKNFININFGNAAASEHVTGSCYHLKTKNMNILLECGLAQSNNMLKDYRTNNEKFNFKVKDLDYLIICHAHADHSMRAPLLYKRGCKAKVLVPKGNARILKDMYEDSAYIAEKDAETLSKQLGRKIEPLYTLSDVSNLMSFVEEYSFNDIHEITEEFKIKFTNSGHIVASAQCEMWIKSNNQIKKILYTSDLGNPLIPKYYVEDFEPVEKANLVIGETTYGDRSREIATLTKRQKDLIKIKEIIINTCINNHNRVLIPVFALDRAPEFLTTLYDIFSKDSNFNIPIVLDSPLMLKHFKSYFNILSEERKKKLEEVFKWKNIVQIGEWKESKHWAENGKSCIILASSGMLTAGRVLNYLPQVISDHYSHILFCGYMTENSLGWKIKNGKDEKTIKIDGKMYRNRCHITSLSSFSSHMQYPQLLNYYSNINADKIALVHGEMKTKIAFAQDLQKSIANKSKTTKVIIINSGTTINL